MTRNTTELIARVRYPYGAFDQTHHDLANALESTVKEMHARELHHFEEEKLRAEAEAKLREAEAVITNTLDVLSDVRVPAVSRVAMSQAVLGAYKPTNQENGRES